MDIPDLEKHNHGKESSPDDTNVGAQVTRSQQIKILTSTSLVAFTVIGLTQAFGVFQAEYTRPAAVQDGIVLSDEIDQRALVSAIGSLGNGGMIAMFAVWHLFATQGVLVGIGSGILIYVMAPILPEYFPERSGLAQGTMYTSAAVGGMVFSFALTKLLEKVGARFTLGILALISLVTLSVASKLALPPRKFEKRSRSIMALKTFREPLFTCLFLVNLIHPLTLAVPMVYGPSFAESLGMGFEHASYLLAINSGVGIPSRLGAGALADKIGHQNTLIMATALYTLATWGLWLPSALSSSVGLYISMSVCHGLINGVFNIVMNSAQKQLFGDEMYYPKNGAMTSIRGLGYAVGGPIAGTLVTRAAGSEAGRVDFTWAIVYVGSLLAVSLACLLNVRRLDARQSGWKWAR
ncbi:hypothetical protein ACEQ8H_006044 [Pleosporales sp. CAS-2024a]